MSLIPKNKIEEAAVNHSVKDKTAKYFKIEEIQSINDFKSGAQFAQNEMPALFCEFGKYCFNMARNPNDKTTTFEQLFELWVENRNK